jgi:type I restriction enzyme R subunit
MQKEASARIKINKLLEQADWRLIGDDRGPANVVLENYVKMTKSSLDACKRFMGISEGKIKSRLAEVWGSSPAVHINS